METMQPKNSNKPTQPAESTKSEPLEGLRVFELRFCVPQGRDIPYVDAHGGIGTLRATPFRDITYLPKMRHHRVVVRSLDAPTRTFYIPESWACFEPLE